MIKCSSWWCRLSLAACFPFERKGKGTTKCWSSLGANDFTRRNSKSRFLFFKGSQACALIQKMLGFGMSHFFCQKWLVKPVRMHLFIWFLIVCQVMSFFDHCLLHVKVLKSWCNTQSRRHFKKRANKKESPVVILRRLQFKVTNVQHDWSSRKTCWPFRLQWRKSQCMNIFEERLSKMLQLSLDDKARWRKNFVVLPSKSKQHWSAAASTLHIVLIHARWIVKGTNHQSMTKQHETSGRK